MEGLSHEKPSFSDQDPGVDIGHYEKFAKFKESSVKKGGAGELQSEVDPEGATELMTVEEVKEEERSPITQTGRRSGEHIAYAKTGRATPTSMKTKGATPIPRELFEGRVGRVEVLRDRSLSREKFLKELEASLIDERNMGKALSETKDSSRIELFKKLKDFFSFLNSAGKEKKEVVFWQKVYNLLEKFRADQLDDSDKAALRTVINNFLRKERAREITKLYKGKDLSNPVVRTEVNDVDLKLAEQYSEWRDKIKEYFDKKVFLRQDFN